MLRVCATSCACASGAARGDADGTTWADVAATTADGTRVAIVHTKYYNRLRGPDGCARYADARGLLATTNARIRVLAWEGYRVRLGELGDFNDRAHFCLAVLDWCTGH